jgi:hypothetical protein
MTQQIDEPTQRIIPDERRYFPYRRPGGVDGVCNICQCRKRLTFDHVPPAGCDNREDVEVNSLRSVMRGVTGENKPTIIQNGLKYRTICKQCNELLGSRYDPALIGLTKFVRAALASPLILPKQINVRTRPAAILRSIIGHLVAAKVETDSCQFDNEVRSCILDETAPVPEKYQLYYWIYPHEKTIVMRDSLLIDTTMPSGKEHIFFQLLKFFPFGFWVLDRSDITSPARFGDFNAVSPSEHGDILIDFSAVREADFPERPTPTRGIFIGQTGSMAAFAQRRRKTRSR